MDRILNSRLVETKIYINKIFRTNIRNINYRTKIEMDYNNRVQNLI